MKDYSFFKVVCSIRYRYLFSLFTTYIVSTTVEIPRLCLIHILFLSSISPLFVYYHVHRVAIPMVLEIPSKDSPYDISKDPIMKRVLQMLGEG